MKDKHVCKKCLCYLCDNNYKCMRCSACDDDKLFIDKNNESLCDEYKEIEDN